MISLGQSPAPQLYILRTASGRMDGHDVFCVMSLSLIGRFSMEILNYIGIVPLRTVHSSLSGVGVGHPFQPLDQA